MKLAYKVYGSGKPLIIVHGLFGFSDNWVTHAKKYGEYFQVIVCDMRNHGYSPWSDDFSYQFMVDDLLELVNDLNIDSFHLMGHSMGGKVAMHFAQQYESMIDKMVIVDMGIKQYPLHHQHILQAFEAIDLEHLSARSEAEKILSTFIDSDGVRQFLLKNLYWKEKGKLAWRVNFPVLSESMPEILGAIPEKEVFTPTLFVRGALSNYIEEEDFSVIETYFPDCQIVSIDNAGHWVHAESPEDFFHTTLEFLIR
jgi:esterase